jgi:hypothetical protein
LINAAKIHHFSKSRKCFAVFLLPLLPNISIAGRAVAQRNRASCNVADAASAPCHANLFGTRLPVELKKPMLLSFYLYMIAVKLFFFVILH